MHHRKDNDLLRIALDKYEQELREQEQKQRNKSRFKKWATKWYRKFHVLPVKKQTYPLQR